MIDGLSQVTRGCIDPDAANYNPDATEGKLSSVWSAEPVQQTSKNLRSRKYLECADPAVPKEVLS